MPKRILSGIVIAAKNNKTITVKVTRKIKHKPDQKIIMLMMKIIIIKLVTTYQ